MNETKLYRVEEFHQLTGYPKERLLRLCRAGKIGTKSDPNAARGWHWLISMKEVKRYWNS